MRNQRDVPQNLENSTAGGMGEAGISAIVPGIANAHRCHKLISCTGRSIADDVIGYGHAHNVTQIIIALQDWDGCRRIVLCQIHRVGTGANNKHGHVGPSLPVPKRSRRDNLPPFLAALLAK
jgi:hypothetical protein